MKTASRKEIRKHVRKVIRELLSGVYPEVGDSRRWDDTPCDSEFWSEGELLDLLDFPAEGTYSIYHDGFALGPAVEFGFRPSELKLARRKAIGLLNSAIIAYRKRYGLAVDMTRLPRS